MWFLEGVLWKWGQRWLTLGTRTMVTEVLGSIYQHQLCWRLTFGIKCWHQSTACRLQCWDVSGQMTNKVIASSHPSAERLLKRLPEPRAPSRHTTPLEMALATKGPDQVSLTSGQTPEATKLPSQSLRN